jgi:hypothetical protein
MIAEFAFDAGVKKRNFRETIGFAAVGKAFIERFGIDVQADGALVKFR